MARGDIHLFRLDDLSWIIRIVVYFNFITAFFIFRLWWDHFTKIIRCEILRRGMILIRIKVEWFQSQEIVRLSYLHIILGTRLSLLLLILLWSTFQLSFLTCRFYLLLLIIVKSFWSDLPNVQQRLFLCSFLQSFVQHLLFL